MYLVPISTLLGCFSVSYDLPVKPTKGYTLVTYQERSLFSSHKQYFSNLPSCRFSKKLVESRFDTRTPDLHLSRSGTFLSEHIWCRQDDLKAISRILVASNETEKGRTHRHQAAQHGRYRILLHHNQERAQDRQQTGIQKGEYLARWYLQWQPWAPQGCPHPSTWHMPAYSW